MKTTFILFILSLTLTQNVSANVHLITSAEEANEFTRNIGTQMELLAEAAKNKDSAACELYQKLQQTLTDSKIVGVFRNFKRLQYRIDWYKNPEVDLYKICTPENYTEAELSFLEVHSHSMKRMRF